jgi:catechol 2,3-dioxygenase-like lactoylglutathione lyase family enzyme
MFLLIECSFSRRAEAELGPCTIAAPTTPNVIVFVSDIDRSVRWYRENVGLAETPRSDFGESHGRAITVMARNRAGVTLVSSYGASHSPRDSQMVCFVLDGPPAPSPGSASLFLVDPDGTSIELPPSGQDRY